MRIFIIFLCLIISISANAGKKKKKPVIVADINAKIIYVVDGDTVFADIEIRDEVYVRSKIRLLEIDAPEMAGLCDYEIKKAIEAKEKLGELLKKDDVVILRKIKNDKYNGRILAQIFKNSNDTKSVSDKMLESGLVREYKGKKRQPWCE